VRTCVRLLMPECRVGVAMGRRGGVTAEPGSTPWAAASAAPAVGRRVRDGCTAWCLGRPRMRRATPLATVRALYMTTATRPSCARRRARRAWRVRRVRRRHGKGAQGQALPLRLRRTRAGVHTCERRGPHGRTRGGTHATRTRRGRSDTARRRQTVAASYGKRGEARWVARASTKAAAPAESGIPAWLDGRPH
jgi:hypothetical protein